MKTSFKRCALVLIVSALVGSTVLPPPMTSVYGQAGKHVDKKIDWITFNKGEVAYKNKDYKKALPLFEKVLPTFVAVGDHVNLANLTNRMGRCEAELGHYAKAEQWWRQEAQYWSKLARRQEVIAANRKADLVHTDIRLFASVPASNLPKLDHGVKYEPKVGAYLGIYAENDFALRTEQNPEALYTAGVPVLLGKAHPVYLIYTSYESSVLAYQSHYRAIAKVGGMVELAIQPMKGLQNVQNDAHLTTFAKEVGSIGVPVMLRFANEMNDPTSSWYFENPKIYIEKFRMVADKIHQYAPNAVMLWAPAYFPPDNITAYYPGDNYVDWVGVSMYRQYHPELDPLGKGVDRFRFTDHFQNIYNLYADKKPIMVSEGAVSYTGKNGVDLTAFASRELKDYLAYMPMLYPKLKGMTYFDTSVNHKGTSYRLSDNSTILQTYKEGIANPFYLSTLNSTADYGYLELKSVKAVLPSTATSLSAYVKSVDPEIASVTYTIGNVKQTVTQVPYQFTFNFGAYAGKSVVVTAEARDRKGNVLTKKTFKIDVR